MPKATPTKKTPSSLHKEYEKPEKKAEKAEKTVEASAFLSWIRKSINENAIYNGEITASKDPEKIREIFRKWNIPFSEVRQGYGEDNYIDFDEVCFENAKTRAESLTTKTRFTVNYMPYSVEEMAKEFEKGHQVILSVPDMTGQPHEFTLVECGGFRFSPEDEFKHSLYFKNNDGSFMTVESECIILSKTSKKNSLQLPLGERLKFYESCWYIQDKQTFVPITQDTKEPADSAESKQQAPKNSADSAEPTYVAMYDQGIRYSASYCVVKPTGALKLLDVINVAIEWDKEEYEKADELLKSNPGMFFAQYNCEELQFKEPSFAKRRYLRLFQHQLQEYRWNGRTRQEEIKKIASKKGNFLILKLAGEYEVEHKEYDYY